MTKPPSLLILLILLVSCVGTRPSRDAVQAGARPRAEATRPNFLIVMSDDQAFSTYDRSLMPAVFSDIVDEGVAFDRAYINTPLCCPSRAQTLTGLYEHHTAVADNGSNPLDRPTIVEALDGAGYRTMLAGKYLNSVGCERRPEFDEWDCYGATGTGYSLKDPIINVNGTNTRFTGYTTDILAGKVRNFVASTPVDQPFFALYTPTSPHTPADDDRYATLPVAPHRPPSYDEDVGADGKPSYLDRTPLSAATKAAIDRDHRVMTRAVPPLDDSIETILDGLGPRAENTFVVYFSDNGWLYGEHRWRYKVVPYEESVRVPFAIRYPPLTSSRRGTASRALVQNIDIAPTMADLAGIPWSADGRSLVPLLDGSAPSVRDAALIQACDGTTPACWTAARTTRQSLALVPFYRGIVTGRYKYVEYVTGSRELYDLAADPFELHNLRNASSHQAIRAQLARDLAALVADPPPETTIAVAPAPAGKDRLAQFRYFTQSSMATYRCRIDPFPGTWTQCNGQSRQVILAPGTYTFSVAATDEAGRADPTPATTTFTIATGGPDIRLTAKPPLLGRARNASFSFSSQSPGSAFECRAWLQRRAAPPFAPCTSPKAYSALPDGTRRFEVRAVDPEGTPTTSPAAWQWTVDTVGPTFHLSQAPAERTTSTTARFVVNPRDFLQGAVTCKLDQGTAKACSPIDAISYTGLAYTSHTFAITGTDLAGNTKTTTYTWTVSRTALTAASATPTAD